ncbi:hypothetical protein GCM10010873_26710 [Cypionkella aquatica]|uniref:HNH nuclease domain-containing protein n=1 Tax=Cypionkella aquatica TaxID=1756042 RepID=A0AA37TUA6_9RHOB|nr:HNH endonuclease signature motif containing protein [Cypionkella aquatica]GLS87697.1 hypothetical protein GCM10010873_26710 [Cypionkella aquatica]
MARLRQMPSRLQPAPRRLAPLITVGEQGRDRLRDATQEWRKWYKTARWQAVAKRIKERDNYTCQWPGCGLISDAKYAMVVDHKLQHHGDEQMFWDEKNLQCLCKPCHDMHKQRQERANR